MLTKSPQLPQLITNYKSKSADGLSMSFLFIWLIGDVANLFGMYHWHPAEVLRLIGCYA